MLGELRLELHRPRYGYSRGYGSTVLCSCGDDLVTEPMKDATVTRRAFGAHLSALLPKGPRGVCGCSREVFQNSQTGLWIHVSDEFLAHDSHRVTPLPPA